MHDHGTVARRSPGLKLVAWAVWLTLAAAHDAPASDTETTVDKLIPVDCLLPGQLRVLGGKASYLGPRRPARIAASECEKSGGEYVAYDRANAATALNVWLKAAEANDPKAQLYTGEIYEKGAGAAPNYERAAFWYAKAAEHDNSDALNHLAYLYERGLGVPKDSLRALNLYRRAAGITTGDITYVEDVNRVRQEDQLKIDALTGELEERDRAAQSFSDSLGKIERQLEEKARAVDRLRGESANLRRQLKKLQSVQQSSSTGAELDRLKRELEDNEHALATQNGALELLQQTSEDQNKSLRAKLEDANREAAALRQQMGDAQSRADSVRNDLVTAQARAQALLEERGRLQDQIKSAEATIGTIRDQLRTAQNGKTNADAKREQELKLRSAEQQLDIDRQRSVAAALEARSHDLDQEVEGLKSALQAAQQNNDKTKNEASQTISELRAALASVNLSLLQRLQEKNQLAVELEKAAHQLSSDSDALSASAGAIGTTDAQIKQLNAKLADRETSIAEMRARITALEASARSDQQVAQDYKAKLDRLGTLRAATNPVPVQELQTKAFAMGQNYALIIGNSLYSGMPHLETAERDADEVGRVLAEQYGFKDHVKILHSATREQMITALYDAVRNAGDKDSLLIYYAGHSALGDVMHRSFWLPVDASNENPSQWISDSDITSWVSETKARHVLIVADSCYSGAMTRGSAMQLVSKSSPAAERTRLQLLSKLPSRTVLTSGGEAPVLDGGPGGHSIFAHEFVELLRENSQVLEVTSLYASLADRVRLDAMKVGEMTGTKITQIPQIAWLQDAGHQTGGEFLFIPSTTASAHQWRVEAFALATH